MFNMNEFLANEIESKLVSVFPNIRVNTYYDSDRDEYSVSISDKELYYSDEYQITVMDIKQNILWDKNIFNYYFTLDEIACENMKILASIRIEYSNNHVFIDYDTDVSTICNNDTSLTYVDCHQLAA